MPSTAVLSGILLLVSYRLSHCVIKVPNTEWIEPELLWLSICMPTGSGKTPLFNFLTSLLRKVEHKDKNNEDTEDAPIGLLDEATFKKMGAMMAANNNKVLGFYDEISTFLAQMNVYHGKGHMIWQLFSLSTMESYNR